MRWKSEGVVLASQWKDNKVVTMLSSIDNAIDYANITRKLKIDNKWEEIVVKQPKVI